MTQQTIPHPSPDLFNRGPLRRRWARGILVGLVVAFVVLLVWYANLFVQLRLSLTDLLYIQQPTTDTIVLVAIDDDTLQAYGSLLGWDRTRYADALNTLVDAEARVVAFDVLFAEPRDGDDAFAAALADANAAGTRTILAASGIERQPIPERPVIAFRRELAPVAPLAQNDTHIAYVNAYPDADGTIRAAISQGITGGEVGQTERLSFALATYLAYFRISPALAPQVITTDTDQITLPPDVRIPIDERGMWYHNFYGVTRVDGTFQTVSFLDVAEGNIDPERFADKIVMIGLMDATGAVDSYPSPVSRAGNMMPGVEVQAHAVETLLQDDALRYENRATQAITILGLGLLTGLMAAYLRWYAILILGVIVIGAWGGYASVMFSAQGMIVNPLPPPLVVFLTTLGSIGTQLSVEIVGRRRAETLLSSLLTVSEQRMELSRILPLVASDIQNLTGAAAGVIWLTDAHGTITAEQTWGGANPQDTLENSYQVAQSQTPYSTKQMLILASTWQGRVIGVLTLYGTFSPAAHARLERFSARIAPTLDSAVLYRQTQRQNQLLNSILAKSPAGILVLDDSLNLIRFNDAAARWLQLYMDDIIGQPISFLLESSAVDEDTWREIGAKLLGGDDFRLELKLQNQTLRLEAAHIRGDGRWVITLGDISDLVELSQLKTRMIRMASHDLKNPLGRIIGYSELMIDMADDGELSEQNQNFIDRILRSANEMLKIISEILDLEHIRSGKANREPVNMPNLVRDVVQRYQDDITDKNQALQLHLPDDVPPLHGDYNQLVQSVSNLIGNASKYTPAGGEIQVRLMQQNGHIRLQVQDNGYGMPAAAMDKLFTEFYRVRTDATKNIQGTGLGLSLVKSVIDAHHGKIWVESELDAGSTFYVELPLGEESERITDE